MRIEGPFNATPAKDSPSRRKIFTCRPTSAAEETTCATQIIKRLATQAYRGVMPGDDFAEEGKEKPVEGATYMVQARSLVVLRRVE